MTTSPRSPAGRCLPLLVHDADPDVGSGSHGPRNARRGRQWVRGHLVRGFRHAVRLEHRRSKRSLEIVHDLRWQRRAARADEAQLFRPGRLRAALLASGQQELMDRRYRRVPGGPVLARDAPERQRVELLRHDDGAAGSECGERRGHQAMHVEQRHHAHRDVVFGERIAARYVTRRDRQIGVRQRHALGAARAAARVQNQRRVVGRWRGYGAPGAGAR